MKKIILLFVSITLYINVSAQVTEGTSPIKWYTIEQAMKLREKEPKPLLIDVYTDWCYWCKVMMNTTFTNPNIAGYINQNFYAVRFNAEGKDTVKFRDTTYYSRGKTHDFAYKLLGRSIMYPTVVYIDVDFNQIVVPGALKTNEIEGILVFFTESVSRTKTVGIEDFRQDFDKTFYKPDSVKYDTAKIQTYTFAQAIELCKSKPRKILVDFYIPWFSTSKMMMTMVYKTPLVAKYLNEKYYFVSFDATSRDTIDFKGYKFINGGKEQNSLHQLTAAYLQNSFIFPTTVVLDEQYNLINKVQGYLPASFLYPISEYFGENYYKTQTWDNYIGEYQKKQKK